ncbi:type II toxin-antitoxin system RelE/ParE family toxin [Vibrio sp. 1403]|uniref:type II toxin-antitoxin system RelE/ParE family toxin n=1 Tax=Vibrio TaxID=662 RepID=UPI00111E8FD8|nr:MULTISPECIES: type II toxin-antitoxin system RelE/ParE family toxin [Vibrio]MDW2298342.1 type II toxin-antitoxin system RelE/ParE family toxin [Vibrio sp. 1404]EGR1161323.1 type II toxin-antitoxin system RelE/ParE family toxin [Vibrio parahaemolyticus]EIN9472671.1 type II toxin-antitoxin system RelE/ParE family toxin [Vibrio parahaemolyticus]MBS9812023.1 type II toxin-antitoxin system RelE/ParE family toxin [Vibrio alginolyticus]MCA2459458.1 type II toxin-antitoxin system RelE/ParE family t
MSQVIYTPSAIRDLDRIREFLKAKDPRAAARAGLKIISSMREVAKASSIGKPIENMPQEFRDWIIEFGKSGYVARYRISGDKIVVLAVRHQKEVGF